MKDNQGNEILDCTDVSFKEYGKLWENISLEAVYDWVKQIEVPNNGNAYQASNKNCESLDAVKQIGKLVYGGMPFQAGPCLGHNKVLNGFEYHNGSEVAICIKPCVMFLGKIQDMEENTYDSKKAIPFYFPKGSIVQTYETTLHYTPCAIGDDIFFTICILPKGTGDNLLNGREGILKKQNKWFIAHEDNIEKIKSGDYPGLKGQMRSIK